MLKKIKKKVKEKGHTSLKLSEINWLIKQIEKLEFRTAMCVISKTVTLTKEEMINYKKRWDAEVNKLKRIREKN